jgi:galactonate dehydratase
MILIPRQFYYIPVTPHGASGPINVVAGAHVMMTVPNFYRVETAHHDLSGYNKFIQTPLDNTDGWLHLPNVPGLGIEMNMDFLQANIYGWLRRVRAQRIEARE